MRRIFIGYDERQAVAYNVCRFSIERRSSVPVAITPLKLDTLPIKREGLTRFTYSRFLVPWLCDWPRGGESPWALFIDSDFLILSDIAELFEIAERDRSKSVYVSKNPHRFEWASMIMFNVLDTQGLTPEFIETAGDLHRLSWLKDDQIGDLPREWNHLVGYDSPRTDAKAVHFTQGMPIFPETEGSEYADEWKAEHKAMNFTLPWQQTMGHSVHAAPTKDGRRVAKLHKDAIKA